MSQPSKWRHGGMLRQVQVLCKDGRIEGALKFGMNWAIPKDTKKPRAPENCNRAAAERINAGGVMVGELKAKKYRRFEDIKHVRSDGGEYWSARELAPVLDYRQWRNFTKVTGKAMIACHNSGHDVIYDFADLSKIVKEYQDAGLWRREGARAMPRGKTGDGQAAHKKAPAF